MVSRDCCPALDLATSPDLLAQRFELAWRGEKNMLFELIAERQEPSNGHGPATLHVPDSVRMTISRWLPSASCEPRTELIG